MQEYSIYDLRCLDRKNPEGIDQIPCFSWKLKSTKQNTFQKTYRIQVWSGQELIWDTDTVTAEATDHVIYQGPELQSKTAYQSARHLQ